MFWQTNSIPIDQMMSSVMIPVTPYEVSGNLIKFLTHINGDRQGLGSVDRQGGQNGFRSDGESKMFVCVNHNNCKEILPSFPFIYFIYCLIF